MKTEYMLAYSAHFDQFYKIEIGQRDSFHSHEEALNLASNSEQYTLAMEAFENTFAEQSLEGKLE